MGVGKNWENLVIIFKLLAGVGTTINNPNKIYYLQHDQTCFIYTRSLTHNKKRPSKTCSHSSDPPLVLAIRAPGFILCSPINAPGSHPVSYSKPIVS